MAVFRLSGNRRRWLLSGAAFMAVVGLMLSFSPGWMLFQRTPTSHETLLYYVAQEIGEPALCDQISWAVYQRYSILFARGGGSYFRSDCYQQVAEARHEPSVCWKVRPLIDFDPISPGYSALACRRRTLARELSGIGLDDKVLIRTFDRLGYDVDQLYLEGVIEPAIKIDDVYRGLLQNPDAIDHAKERVAATISGLRDDDASYLAHLAAIATADVRWCAYIPADQSVNQEPASFRDWCYYTVAENMQDASICQRMKPAAEAPKVIAAIAHGMRPEIAVQLSLRSQCDAIARGVAHGMRLQYGAELPRDSRQTLRLLAAVGVTMPSARNWSTWEIAAYYRRFLFELRPDNRDLVHDAARGRLLHKLLALPNDT